MEENNSLSVIQVDELPEVVTSEVVDVSDDRPFWTTDFSDYTVTEGLLLLLVLLSVIHLVMRIVKGGFSWL